MSDAIEIRVAPGTIAELSTLLVKMDEVAVSASKMAGSGKALEELRKIMVGVGKSGGAFTELRASMDALNASMTQSLNQLMAKLSELPTGIAASLKGLKAPMAQAGAEAGQALGEATAKSAKKSLEDAAVTVRQAVAKLQKEYETAVAQGAKFSEESLKALKGQGVSLFPDDRVVLAQAAAWRAALKTGMDGGIQEFALANAEVQKQSEYMLAGMKELYSGLEKSTAMFATVWAKLGSMATSDNGLRLLSSNLHKDSELILAEMAKFYEGFNTSVNRSEAILGRLGKLGAADTGLRLLQSDLHNDSTLILAEMAKFYEGMSASVTRTEVILAKLGSLATSDNGLRLLSSSLHNDSALVLSEMAKFYEGLEAGEARLKKVWDKMGSLATQDNGLRLLASKLHEDSGAVLSAMNTFYTQMEEDNVRLARVADLKAQIRSRLASNGGSVAAGPASLTTTPSSTQTLGAMKDFYLSQGAVQGGLKPSDIDPATEALNRHNKALAQLTDHANEAHSAARGLASGFGAMFLTWGSMIPLMAGAGISNAIVQMVKLGSAVEQDMYLMATLGDMGAEGMAKLDNALLKIASGGVFGPRQVAEALKAMSMAGLDASQSMAALGATLQFAQLGEMSTKTSVESLAGIAQAFGYSTRDWSRVGDVITATAAATTSTIQTMTEGFKHASVIAQEYGVSLTDASTALGLLNQIGVRGSSGGTALQQMYNSLSGATKRAKDEMKALGLQTVDEQGNLLPFRELIINTAEALMGYNNQSQQQALIHMLNVRGMKAVVAGMAGYRAEQAALGKSSEETILSLQKLADTIAEAPGIMAITTAQMSTTSENLMKGVKSSLETSLTAAFNGLSPILKQVSLSLMTAFSSDEFRSALTTIGVMVGNITKFVVDHAGEIAKLLEFYIRWRVALLELSVIMGAFAALTKGIAAYSAAATVMQGFGAAATLAANAVLGTTVALTGMQLVMGGIAVGALIGIGYLVSWALAEDELVKHNREKVAALAAGSMITQKALDDEAERLQKVIVKMREGKTEAQALAEVKTQLAIQDIHTRYDILKADKDAEAQALKTAIARSTEAHPGTDNQYALQRAKMAESLARVNGEYQNLVRSEMLETASMERSMGIVKQYSATAAKLADQQAADNIKKIAGSKVLPEPPKAYADNIRGNNAISQLSTEFDKKMAELTREDGEEKKLTDAYRKAGLLSNAAYDYVSLQEINNTQATKLSLIASYQDKLTASTETAKKKIADNVAGGMPALMEAASKTGKAFGELDPELKKSVAEYEALMAASKSLAESLTIAKTKTIDLATERQKLLAIDNLGAINKEITTYGTYLSSIDRYIEKKNIAHQLAIQDLNLTDRERAGYAARNATEAEFAKDLDKTAEELDKAKASYEDYLTQLNNAQIAQDAFNQMGIFGADAVTGLNETVDELANKAGMAAVRIGQMQDQLTLLKAKVAAASSANEGLAVALFDQKAAMTLRNNIAQSLTDALMKGTAGFKSLWSGLQTWLKKLFAETVLLPQVKTIVSGVMSASGLISGTVSANGSTVDTTTGGATGTAVGAVNAGSALNKVYDFYTGTGSGTFAAGLQSIYNNFAQSTIGQSAGLSTYTAGNNISAGGYEMAGGGSTMGSSLAAGASTVGYGVIGAVVGTAISDGFSAIGNKPSTAIAIGEVIGGAIGTYFGATGVGMAIGGAVGGVVNRAFGHQPETVTGRTLAGTFSGAGNFQGTTTVSTVAKGGWFSSDQNKNYTKAVEGELETMMNSAATSVVKSVSTYAKALSLPTSQLETINSQISVEISSSAIDALSKKYGMALDMPYTQMTAAAKKIAGTKEYSDAIAADAQANSDAVNRALQQFTSDLTDSFQPALQPFMRAGEDTITAITRIGNSLATVNQVFKALKFDTLSSTLASGDRASTIVDNLGGATNFQAVSKDYNTNFYSAAEQSGAAAATLSDALKEVNIDVPNTTEGLIKLGRDGFRAMVEAAVGSGNDSAYVALMKVEGAFASLVPVAGESQKSIDLNIAQLTAQGKTIAATEATRAQEIIALQKTNPELVALQQSVWALGDAATLAATKSTMDIAYLRAQGKETEAVAMERQNEINALQQTSPSLVDYQRLIWAVGDATAHTAAVTSERIGLEGQVLTLTNNTVEIRRRERAALDPLNQAMYDYIKNLEDVATATAMLKTVADALKGAVTQALADLKTAIDSQSADLKTIYDAATKVNTTAKDAATSAHTAETDRINKAKKDAQDSYKILNDALTAQITAIDNKSKAIAAQYKADSKAIADEKTDAQKAYKIQADTYKTFIKSQTEIVNTLKTVHDSLDQTLRALLPIGQEGISRQRAQDQLANMLNTAKTTGALPKSKADIQTMQDALSVVSKPSEDLFGSFVDYQRDFYKTAINIRDLNDISGSQLDVAQTALDNAQAASDKLDTEYQANMDRLDGIKQALDDANVIATDALAAQRETLVGQQETAKTALDNTIAGLDAQQATADTTYKTVTDNIAADQKALDDKLAADLKALTNIYDEAVKHTNLLTGLAGKGPSIPEALDKLGVAIGTILAADKKGATGTVVAAGDLTGTGGSIVTPAKNQWNVDSSGSVKTFNDSKGAVAGNKIDGATGDATIKTTTGELFTINQMVGFVNANLNNPATIKAKADASGITLTNVDSAMGFTTGTLDAITGNRTLNGVTFSDVAAFIAYQKSQYPNDPKTFLDHVRNKALQSGFNAATLDAIMGWPTGYANTTAAAYGLPSFAVGGQFAGGTALVGENGPELIRMGPSRIMNNADTQRLMFGTGQRDDAIVQWLQKVSDQLDTLDQNNNAGQQAIASNTSRTAKVIVDRWDIDGMPPTRT